MKADREDGQLFVRKHWGWGLTVDWGNPKARIMFGTALALILGIPFVGLGLYVLLSHH